MVKENVQSFLNDYKTKNDNRFHKINWDSTNIPIQRKDFNWVDKNIVENEEEYPFFQFQVSRALGRVVGFWKEDYSSFFILLLDYKHNIQPSKKYEYSVDDTTILPCAYTSLLVDIDNIKSVICSNENCLCKEKLSQIPSNQNIGNFVYFQLDDEYHIELMEKLKYKSLKDVIEMGLLNML